MTKLNITYKDGRGRLEIILDNLLPCTPADFKRLLSFVEMSDQPQDHATVIFDFISGKVDELQKEREKYDPDSAFGRPQRARINTTIRRHISNAAQLSKVYGFPEIEDDAKITYKAGTVYAVITNDEGKAVAESFDGWTFQKAGYVFDVYKSKRRKACYHILLHGTGLSVATVTNRNQAADAITPRILDVIKNAAEKMDGMQEDFKRCMVAAGFMDADERTETIPNAESENNTENEEENAMAKYEFEKDKITIDGTTYPAKYIITKYGTVNVFAILSVEDNGRTNKKAVRISQDQEEYGPAYNAAIASHAPDYRESAAKVGEAGKRHETENNTENGEASAITNYLKYLKAPNYEFAKDTITIDGITYPAEYTIAKNGVVNVFAILSIEDDGRKNKKAVRIPQNYDEYGPAYNAALASHAPDYRESAAKVGDAEKRPENIPVAAPAAKAEDKPEPEAPQPKIVYTDENGTARDPKAARGPIPEKTFIGSVIQGRGWKILFDGITNRTRVIFDGKPTDAARAATENAGFYYSPNMQSWNKKLTFRAYRAAQSLSCTLNELYAA